MMPKTTVLDLLRHGEVEGGDIFRGSTNDKLTDDGWEQMQATLQGDVSWDVIISSPLLRCAEFAGSLADQEDINCEIIDALEEIHFGEWEGQSPDDLLKDNDETLKRWWASPTKQAPPEGEDFHDFRARVLKTLKQITEEYKGKRILLVTHAGVIRVILMYILGMQEENLFRLNVDYASLSTIRMYHDETGAWGTLISHGCHSA
ncbi:MAG TPA: histidine phosphatase family protein [Leucothrix mucor]|uniref:Histidine phosphatase family protein n=1 Tax=Leucothrix mucor TaxID=45248 RepID=A0A7V2T265_LEUMU|nr:histidine phosphatase family protein [Leucothrix mucor]